jgi:hypothetical protein
MENLIYNEFGKAHTRRAMCFDVPTKEGLMKIGLEAFEMIHSVKDKAEV